MKKQWKITGAKRQGFSIAWRWSNSRGTSYHYWVGTQKTPKTWKTKVGATRYGLKTFGNASDN